jgi:hypothetical protein
MSRAFHKTISILKIIQIKKDSKREDMAVALENRNQRPAVAGCGGLLQNRTESFQKPVSIGIVFNLS